MGDQEPLHMCVCVSDNHAMLEALLENGFKQELLERGLKSIIPVLELDPEYHGPGACGCYEIIAIAQFLV